MIHKRSLILIGVCAGIITRALLDQRKARKLEAYRYRKIERSSNYGKLQSATGSILGMSVPLYIANFGGGE